MNFKSVNVTRITQIQFATSKPLEENERSKTK